MNYTEEDLVQLLVRELGYGDAEGEKAKYYREQLLALWVEKGWVPTAEAVEAEAGDPVRVQALQAAMANYQRSADTVIKAAKQFEDYLRDGKTEDGE